MKKVQNEKEAATANLVSYNNYILNQNYDEVFNQLNSDDFSCNSAGSRGRTINTRYKRNAKNSKRELGKMIKNKIKGNLSKNKKLGNRGKTRNKSKEQAQIIVEESVNSNVRSSELDSSGWEDITYKELDGKVGRHEKIYCFCNYVSYGNMIKCDNPKCVKEWFHFHCVGLKNQPKGKWFCSENCVDEFKRGELSYRKNSRGNSCKRGGRKYMRNYISKSRKVRDNSYKRNVSNAGRIKKIRNKGVRNGDNIASRLRSKDK